jgi:hypothetical protein
MVKYTKIPSRTNDIEYEAKIENIICARCFLPMASVATKGQHNQLPDDKKQTVC